MIRHMVAIDSKRGIAKNGVQPWKLPIDEHYFAEQTKLFGGIVLMGRKTYEVIGSALPERQNFVLTRDQEFKAEGVTVIHDLDAFLATQQDVWIIGGAELYTQTLHRASELYITEIEHDFDSDTFYPQYAGFELIQNSGPLSENGNTFSFKIYKSHAT